MPKRRLHFEPHRNAGRPQMNTRCANCKKMLYRTDPCKGTTGACGRTDGGSKKMSGGSSAVRAGRNEKPDAGSYPAPRSKPIVGRPKDGPTKKSTAAPVSEPRKGQPKPGKGASRTVPQASHADNRVEVASGRSDPSRTTGGRHQQPALRTEVALGAVDLGERSAQNIELAKNTNAIGWDSPLTKRGTPRKRAPKGTFDRKAYHRELMRKSRAAKAKETK